MALTQQGYRIALTHFEKCGLLQPMMQGEHMAHKQPVGHSPFYPAASWPRWDCEPPRIMLITIHILGNAGLICLKHNTLTTTPSETAMGQQAWGCLWSCREGEAPTLPFPRKSLHSCLGALLCQASCLGILSLKQGHPGHSPQPLLSFAHNLFD